jgi:hypothetical protein
MLKKGDMFKYILAHQFDLNTAATQAICKDKCAAFDILSYHHITCVEHFLFMPPASGFSPKDGNYKELYRLLDKYGKLVLKPNEGTSGSNVYSVTCGAELARASDQIFKGSESLAVSPFYEIEKELRVIVLDGSVKLVFSKELPSVLGDGSSSLAELVAAASYDAATFDFSKFDFRYVPKKGEIVTLGWKHNLAHGASAKIVDFGHILNDLTVIALKASDALGIRFASIDIVITGRV